MTFSYRCPEGGHLIEQQFAVGKAPGAVFCDEHNEAAPRDWSADSMPQIGVDPFRQYDLSPRKEAAQAEQQRYVDAPRDRIEARAIEATTGRRYVGDDTSGMTKAARQGIEKAKDAKRKTIVPVAG